MSGLRERIADIIQSNLGSVYEYQDALDGAEALLTEFDIRPRAAAEARNMRAIADGIEAAGQWTRPALAAAMLRGWADVLEAAEATG